MQTYFRSSLVFHGDALLFSLYLLQLPMRTVQCFSQSIGAYSLNMIFMTFYCKNILILLNLLVILYFFKQARDASGRIE